MTTLAANVSTLFKEVPFLERFRQAREAGFGAVEAQFPYAFPPDDVARALRESDLKLVLINAPAGDLEAGERGLALEQGPRFEESIRLALDYARATACPRVHVLIGKTRSSLGRRAPTYVLERLRSTAREFAGHGIELMLEALNRHDQPGYALPTLEAADALRSAVGAGNVRLLFDAYHVQRSGADVVATLARFMPAIGHVQVSRVPDRSEPDPARVSALIETLKRHGYGGFVGCEYNPRNGTASGLGWARDYGIGTTCTNRK